MRRGWSYVWSTLAITLALLGTPLHAEFAYVANADGTVSGYTIDPVTGALKEIAGSPFLAGAGPNSVAVDPSGKFAYVANLRGNTVSGYTINPTTGALTAITGSPFAAGSAPSCVAVDPSGKFAYVGYLDLGGVSGYTINPTTGALTVIAGSTIAAGITASVTVDPSGRFVYVANFSGNTRIASSVSGATINPGTGELTNIAGSPFAAGIVPESVAVDPSGKFAYVANLFSSISEYTIDPVIGALKGIEAPLVEGGAYVAVDPSGKFAYVLNLGGFISEYTIDPAIGALTAIAGSPVATGAISALWRWTRAASSPTCRIQSTIPFRGSRSTRRPGRSRPSPARLSLPEEGRYRWRSRVSSPVFVRFT